ncbi:DHH phosphoesterase [Meira miltonrushii]|uniref:DHH phosphoesterase n=1 Tax=Meira miltonrushii TaxID=1280837 RepID=A0A316V3N1_9BASI|nr:DHH phosphoesterase [Meira miltonrushii]PWN32140.1 DHH phosphoesterase [Meira miltonrushii]
MFTNEKWDKIDALYSVDAICGFLAVICPGFENTYKQKENETPPYYWPLEEGVGHFSQWSKSTKRQFVDEIRLGKASEWVVVMGNEGGDLDSMTAALTWSYHLSHLALNTTHTLSQPDPNHPPHPKKAIALLQTPRDALDLRPENKLALRNVQMSPGHRDLLTIDELPLPAEELAKQLKGIVLVDHPQPLSVWEGARVLSIFDHHKDRGNAPDARPRIFEGTASCTTIVAREMLNELEELPKEYHMPHEVVELILDAIALDSDGLKKGTPEDKFTSRRLLKRSNWKSEKLLEVMDRLDNEMKKAKKDLEDLGVRDLLRRDWKGDIVKTKSERYPEVHLGLASIPYSLDDQIKRTLHETTQSWFEIEGQWTKEIKADISLSLNSYKLIKKKVEKDGKQKVREVCLVVRASHRLDENSATSLFNAIKETIDESPFIDAEPWHKVDELEQRQMVWVHHVPNGGRKLIRPIIEDAVKNWK